MELDQQLEQEIQLLDSNVTLIAKHGDLDDGVLVIDEVEVEFSDNFSIDFDEEIPWFDTETLQDEVEKVLHTNTGETWKETFDEDWDTPQFVSTDTHSWKVLKAIAETAPCTSSEVDELVDIPYGSSSPIVALKKKKLVRVIGTNEDGVQVIVPTHLGIKELSTVYGVYLDDLTDYGLFKLTNADHDDIESEESMPPEHTSESGEEFWVEEEEEKEEEETDTDEEETDADEEDSE